MNHDQMVAAREYTLRTWVGRCIAMEEGYVGGVSSPAGEATGGVSPAVEATGGVSPAVEATAVEAKVGRSSSSAAAASSSAAEVEAAEVEEPSQHVPPRRRMRKHHAQPGQYWRTREAPTRIRCKAYSQPEPHGEYLATIDPGTYLGPVEMVDESSRYTAILVRGFWINVWGRGTCFAQVVPDSEVQGWYQQGWHDDPEPDPEL